MRPRSALRLARLATFRAMHVAWPEHARTYAAALREILRAAPPPPRDDADLTLVLPSYGRPQNLALSVRLALAAPSVRRIVVVNDHPGVRLARWIEARDPRLTIVDRAVRVGPVARYLAARESGGELFLSVDDDLFLLPSAIERLGARLRADPSVPHGLYGQRFDGRRLIDNLARVEARVDVLNRAYAFTRAHLDAYFELLEALSIDPEDPRASVGLDDDLVLSFAGEGLPRIHELGPWLDCPSERRRGLARWRRRDAEEVRLALFHRLAAVRPRPRCEDPWPEVALPASPRSLPWAALHEAAGLGALRRLRAR